MSHPVTELVIYKVKNPQTATLARRQMQAHFNAHPGFLAWQPLSSTSDACLFADIVTWTDEASARSAGEKVMTDEACAPLMAEIAEIISMGHYA